MRTMQPVRLPPTWVILHFLLALYTCVTLCMFTASLESLDPEALGKGIAFLMETGAGAPWPELSAVGASGREGLLPLPT